MWELLTAVFQSHGLVALIELLEVFVIIYLFKTLRTSDAALLEMSNKRLKDALDSKEDYEDLSKSLDKSIDLLIRVFKKRNGG